MVLGVESRIGQETLLPISTGEALERVLTEMIGGDFEEIANQKLVKLYSLSPYETIELNPRLHIGRDSKIINLYTGSIKGHRASLDVISPWSKTERPSQIITRNPQIEVPRYFDAPSIYHLFRGRMGIYTGENFQREEILHDHPERPWTFSIVSGRSPHNIITWEQPAFVWTTVPDTAYVSPDQINLPL